MKDSLESPKVNVASCSKMLFMLLSRQSRSILTVEYSVIPNSSLVPPAWLITSSRLIDTILFFPGFIVSLVQEPETSWTPLTIILLARRFSTLSDTFSTSRKRLCSPSLLVIRQEEIPLSWSF